MMAVGTKLEAELQTYEGLFNLSFIKRYKTLEKVLTLKLEVTAIGHHGLRVNCVKEKSIYH